MQMSFRRPYDGDELELSVRSGLECTGTVLTQQHMKDECDINVLVARFGVTQVPSRPTPAFYGDFSDITDYHSAAEAVLQARESFLLLDPKVRRRFRNDPGAFLAWSKDAANQDEAIALGIAVDRRPSPPEPGVVLSG